MPHREPEAVARAVYYTEIEAIVVLPVEGVECQLVRLVPGRKKPKKVETPEAYAFRLPGQGMDDATFFVCRDVATEEASGCQPLFVASEVTFGAILPGCDRYSEREAAVRSAIRFVIDLPEEGRAEAWERMKAFGVTWRDKP